MWVWAGMGGCGCWGGWGTVRLRSAARRALGATSASDPSPHTTPLIPRPLPPPPPPHVPACSAKLANPHPQHGSKGRIQPHIAHMRAHTSRTAHGSHKVRWVEHIERPVLQRHVGGLAGRGGRRQPGAPRLLQLRIAGHHRAPAGGVRHFKLRPWLACCEGGGGQAGGSRARRFVAAAGCGRGRR